MTTDPGKPILTTLVSDQEIVTVNATPSVTTVITRNRESGEVKQEVFYGRNPLVNR